MKLRTEYISTVSPNGFIPHDSKMILTGSCFSENIGSCLLRSGFHTLVNPWGIIFNPISIAESVTCILRKKKFRKNDFFERDGFWYNYKLHGSLAGESVEDACKTINETIVRSHEFLMQADVLIFTLGTAWVYELRETGKIVANCHKAPQKNFKKRILSHSEIVNCYSSLITHLRSANSSLRIIFTVSPVRHLRDGIIENNLSKSTLILSVHELLRKFECAEYFPAYEIVMDDLRDYRFVGKDMCHPNELAIEYVWQKFTDSYFSAAAKKEMKLVEDWFNKLNHRPLHKESSAWKKFEAALRKETELMLSKYPHLGSLMR